MEREHQKEIRIIYHSVDEKKRHRDNVLEVICGVEMIFGLNYSNSGTLMLFRKQNQEQNQPFSFEEWDACSGWITKESSFGNPEPVPSR